MNPNRNSQNYNFLQHSNELTNQSQHISVSNLPVTVTTNSKMQPSSSASKVSTYTVRKITQKTQGSTADSRMSSNAPFREYFQPTAVQSSVNTVSTADSNTVEKKNIVSKQVIPIKDQQGSQQNPQYQAEITTQPSSLASVNPNSTEANALKEQVISRINELKKIISTFEELIDVEFTELAAIDSIVQQSKLIFHDVTHNLKTATVLINTRNEQLEAANERIKLLMGEDLTECTNENLEDISDILWSGLQAATLALSRRQNKALQNDPSAKQESEKTGNCYISTNIPEARFVPLTAPPIRNRDMTSERLYAKIISLLEEVQEIQQVKRVEFKKLNETFNSLQKQISEANEQYDEKRTTLLLLEKKLDTRSKQVNRLTGRDGYESLTIQQLVDLCKTINKASRRLTTEQAIREVQSQQKTKDIKSTDNKCFVCFERPINCLLEPCQHSLCSECAERLNFCPHCRQQINSKKNQNSEFHE